MVKRENKISPHPAWYNHSFDHPWQPQVIKTQDTALHFLQTDQQPRPFEPAEIPDGQDRWWVFASTTEAVCRQTLSCQRMDHLQMGTTGQPGEATASLKPKEKG